MARTLGEAGKFVSDEADRKHRQMLIVGFVVFGLILLSGCATPARPEAMVPSIFDRA